VIAITALRDLGVATPYAQIQFPPFKGGPHKAFTTINDGISQMLAAEDPNVGTG
jgi:hypothetical protein